MSADVMEFTDANFGQQVEGAEGLTVVDFWAPWCGPCRFVAPVIEQLAAEYAGRIKVGKLNVDDSPETAARYGIRSIPTIGFFKDGEPQEGIVGAVALPVLRDTVERQLTGS